MFIKENAKIVSYVSQILVSNLSRSIWVNTGLHTCLKLHTKRLMPTFKKRLIDIISFSNRPTATLLRGLFDFDFSQPGMAHSTSPVVCDEVKFFLVLQCSS